MSPAGAREVALTVTGVCKTYERGDTRLQALEGVSLTLQRGDFAALVGPSGSGKSSLLNIVGTLDRPNEGAVTIGDEAVDYDDEGAMERLRRRHLGFIFQTFNLVPVLTAIENVEVPLLLLESSARERRARAAAALDAVGLADRLDHRPRELSGGQQQRVAVARALVRDPTLVLADEPTANLDSRTAFALLDLLLALNSEQGTTFLFSTHDHRLIERLTRIFALKDGRLVA